MAILAYNDIQAFLYAEARAQQVHGLPAGSHY